MMDRRINKSWLTIVVLILLFSVACIGSYDVVELELGDVVDELGDVVEFEVGDVEGDVEDNSEVVVQEDVQAEVDEVGVSETEMPATQVFVEVQPVEIDDSLYPPGDFDYLVMSLSWSPDYCATSGQDDAQQCAIGRQLAFVLHGLWPQYEDGWPQYCTDEELPAGIEEDFLGLYPSDKLFDHEWEKHGTCSGLSPADYLQLSALIKNSVVIPAEYQAPQEPFQTTVEEVQGAFVAANPDFVPDTVAVRCSSSGRFLKELFVCFEKDGQSRACSDDVLKSAARTCQQADFMVRNVR